MDNNNEINEKLIKKSVNISTNIFNRKIFLNVTLKQILTITIFSIFNIAISSIIAISWSIIGAIIFCGIFLIITICLSIKNCLGLVKLKDLIKFIFTTKNKKQKEVSAENGIIKYNKKKFMIFEIQTSPLAGTEFEVLNKINKVINNLSTLNNFSIISTQTNFDELDNTEKFVLNKINLLDPNNYNKIELDTLLANQFLINNYISGDYPKNTYLLIIQLDSLQTTNNIFNWVKTINSDLYNFNFKIKQIVNEKSLSICLNNLFDFNNKILIKSNYIQSNQNKFSHYIKIVSLPCYLESAYLSVIQEYKTNKNINIDYSINTYNFHSQKKEEKVWENNVKYFEFLFNKAKKNKDIQIANENIDAIQELSANLIANKNQLVKFDLILKVSCNNLKLLKKEIRNFKNYLTKFCKFELESSLFTQWDLFNAFQRNFGTKNNNNYLILPIDLVLWSYPFAYGNNYIKNGLYIGSMDNNNPVFLSLNSGDKKNNSTLIIGKTGSGKSEFIKFLTKNNCAEQNITTFILDPKGEYCLDKDMLDLNPQIINFENNNDINLNPFEICENESIENKINFILEFLSMFFKDNDFTTEIKNILLSVISKIINSNQDFTISSIYQYILNLIRTQKDDDLIYTNVYRLILNILEPLLPDGAYGYFSKKSHFHINNKLVIFNLSALLTSNNDINKIKLKLLLAKIKKYIYTKSNLINSGNKIQIICDEFPVLANPKLPFISNEFVTMIRLVRSYDTSLILAMQDVDTLKTKDSGSLEQIKSIANNTKHIFLFHLNQDQLNELKALWGNVVELSKNESYRITTDFNPGDCLYINGTERYYINVTDPLKPYSPYHDMIWNYINDLKEFVNE